MSEPLLFLSHAGVDTDAALALADRLEAAPDARACGLKVWIDKRDLVAGIQWKTQLQKALARSTAFAVYVGSRGVVNWVWDEVSVALDRAHLVPDYPVVPVLASGVRPDTLPSFLSQHQGVRDIEHDHEAFLRLVRSILRLEARDRPAAEAQPFRGLSAFDSRHAHLFFGRARDTAELVELLRAEHLVMVVGDSGSGKSSLVKAGVAPAFLGGALASQSGDGPDIAVWRVLHTRPLGDPFEKLAECVRSEAVAAGHDLSTCSQLADLVRGKRPSAIKDALQLSGLPGAKILLIVDQFEELFTLSAPSHRETFAEVLLSLADPTDDGIRILLTMRWDHYHLCSMVPRLRQRLERG